MLLSSQQFEMGAGSLSGLAGAEVEEESLVNRAIEMSLTGLTSGL